MITGWREERKQMLSAHRRRWEIENYSRAKSNEKNRAWRNEGREAKRIELCDTDHKINRRIFIPFRHPPIRPPLVLCFLCAYSFYVSLFSPPCFLLSLVPSFVLTDYFISRVGDSRKTELVVRALFFWRKKIECQANLLIVTVGYVMSNSHI